MTKSSPPGRSRALAFALVAGMLVLATPSARMLAADRDDSDDRQIQVASTYFQNFRLYSGTFLRRLADNGVASKLDLLAHAFVDIRADQAGNPHCAAFDEFADYQFFFDQTRSVDGSVDSFADGALRGQVHQFQELKQKFPHLKII